MNNEEMLQKTLNATIDRLGTQAKKYEADIANLNAQIIVMQDQIDQLRSSDVNEDGDS